MNQQTSEIVIRKSVTVAAPPERAFHVFTEGIGTWWPLHTYSVDPESADTAVMEGRVGGRIFERTPGGEEHTWGKVTAWEPPNRVVFTWHPGREEESAQEVEVTFTPAGGDTRVELAHYGWEKLGERMAETASGYDKGWDTVIALYAEAAGALKS